MLREIKKQNGPPQYRNKKEVLRQLGGAAETGLNTSCRERHIANIRNRGRFIQLNPQVVDQLVEVLQRYQKQLTQPRSRKRLSVSKSRQQKVQDRYFKNVPMNEIGMQLGLSEQKVEAILRKRGIQIVPFKIPFWKRRRKR